MAQRRLSLPAPRTPPSARLKRRHQIPWAASRRDNRSRRVPDGDRSRDRGTTRRAFAHRWRACCLKPRKRRQVSCALRTKFQAPIAPSAASGRCQTKAADARQQHVRPVSCRFLPDIDRAALRRASPRHIFGPRANWPTLG